MNNIFFKKSYTKCGGEESPRTFYKKPKIEHISGSTVWSVIKIIFIVCRSRGALKLGCWPLVFTVPKAFLKTKRSGTSLRSLFSTWFWRKRFLTFYSNNWPNFITWFSLLLEILGNMFIVYSNMFICPVCEVINFENNHSFFIKPFFYITKKSGQKCQYLNE